MRLLLLRHAESASNADPHAVTLPEERGDRLTERGFEQARVAAAALRDCGADRLLSSPMRRARETAEVLAAELGLTIEVDDEIHELRELTGFGELAPEKQKLRRWSEWMSAHPDDPDHAPPGAESFNAMLRRVRGFKARLEAGDPSQSVLCVSHGIFIRFLLVDSLLGDRFEPREAKRLWHLRSRNCGLSVFEHAEARHPADPELDDWACVSWMERCWSEGGSPRAGSGP